MHTTVSRIVIYMIRWSRRFGDTKDQNYGLRSS